MAVNTTNVTYINGRGSTGWMELDIREKIELQDPRDTPFFEMTGSTTARADKHEWQVRGLRARALNANLEGADFTFRAQSGPSRVSNTTQIFHDGVEVSGTQRAIPHYGARDIMRDQIDLRAIEHRNDMEWSLINGVESLGNTNETRRMDGLVASVVTNATALAGLTLTETIYVDGIELVWNTGARCDTVLLPAPQQRQVDSFDAEGATKWIDTTTREITNQVLVYHSSFGTVMNHLTRDLSTTASNGQIVFFDKSMMRKAWLRTTKLMPVAKTVDGDRVAMVSELTLEYLNEKASAYFSQLLSP